MRHTDPNEWLGEVTYVYDCLCREVADTPLLANLSLGDFVEFCRGPSYTCWVVSSLSTPCCKQLYLPNTSQA